MTLPPITLQCQLTATNRGEPLAKCGRAKCVGCNSDVFICRTAVELSKTLDVIPMCEMCQPASHVTPSFG